MIVFDSLNDRLSNVEKFEERDFEEMDLPALTPSIRWTSTMDVDEACKSSRMIRTLISDQTEHPNNGGNSDLEQDAADMHMGDTTVGTVVT